MTIKAIKSLTLAYKAIRAQKMSKKTYQKALDRRATTTNVGRAKYMINELQGVEPSDRHNDFSRKFRYFIWMTSHNGYKNGDYWTHIPTLEYRANCITCGNPESMEHILKECENSHQKTVWSLAENLWHEKKTKWIEPNFGIILGCGLIRITNDKGKHLPGDSRLYRILISESAHLIWKIRCEKAIQGREISDTEVKHRWKKTIESRLELDCLRVKMKHTGKHIDNKLVKSTWNEVLNGRDNLPENWMEESGVLVGIRSGMG
ncbi:hypothetical protein DFJ43DRAFT_1214396 [Lentinula guzmanii]|uniref:Reverse transcriptase zinc-binding domain-containing protein n=1 Tax=Lentinula guzmanii TaxID=2804957 RepID=A0AA38JGM8_9AGAR|nr:hypothetical protein DFJ43DRAFT_1214396 [Lentinula guzmanii]